MTQLSHRTARLPPGWWLLLCDADGNPTPRGDYCRAIGPRDITTQIYRLNDTSAAVAEAQGYADAALGPLEAQAIEAKRVVKWPDLSLQNKKN